jgi:hypothetical protein
MTDGLKEERKVKGGGKGAKGMTRKEGRKEGKKEGQRNTEGGKAGRMH